MPKLVKQNSIEDIESFYPQGEINAAQITENTYAELETFLSLVQSDAQVRLGVCLKSDDDVNALAPFMSNVSGIACKFEAFADGRSFSQAQLLRDTLDYKGSLRAVGAFVQDQLFYLKRCGFDEFEMPEDSDFDSISQSLQDFSESYQAASDNPEPLFRRRS